MNAVSEKLDLVLLIDDDDLANTLNSIILRQSGLVNSIEAVRSGDKGLQALEVCQSENKWPAIIFVDINMPGINGWEFITIFGEKFATFKRKCIICLLSSSLDPRDREKVNTSEFIDFFISKPLSIEIVSDLCDKYYDLK
jgi:CheY-like chemotaxis protein